MKQIILIIFLFFACFVNAKKLVEITNAEISKILPNFEILAEAKYPKSIIHIRILKVGDHGECDGSPQSCPMSTIYVTASEYGEYPIQKTYVLPKKHLWEFVEWVEFTEYEGQNNYVQIKLKAQIPNVDISKTWWQDEYYLLKVNYHNGQWEKL